MRPQAEPRRWEDTPPGRSWPRPRSGWGRMAPRAPCLCPYVPVPCTRGHWPELTPRRHAGALWGLPWLPGALTLRSRPLGSPRTRPSRPLTGRSVSQSRTGSRLDAEPPAGGGWSHWDAAPRGHVHARRPALLLPVVTSQSRQMLGGRTARAHRTAPSARGRTRLPGVPRSAPLGTPEPDGHRHRLRVVWAFPDRPHEVSPDPGGTSAPGLQLPVLPSCAPQISHPCTPTWCLLFGTPSGTQHHSTMSFRTPR